MKKSGLVKSAVIGCGNVSPTYLYTLCKKPLASKMSDMEKMIEACDKGGIKFSTMLQRRLYPNTIAAREAVKKGLLGKIRNVELNFSCYKKKEFYSGWRAAK